MDLVLGGDYLTGLEDYDVVFVGPASQEPAPARSLTGKLSFPASALVLRYCQAPVFGITEQRDSTTSLVGKCFAPAVLRPISGNIGTPSSNRCWTFRRCPVCFELSSFQLEQL